MVRKLLLKMTTQKRSDSEVAVADVGDVAAGLRKYETGRVMHEAQKDVEDLLELLINALRRTIEKKEGGG